MAFVGSVWSEICRNCPWAIDWWQQVCTVSFLVCWWST